MSAERLLIRQDEKPQEQEWAPKLDSNYGCFQVGLVWLLFRYLGYLIWELIIHELIQRWLQVCPRPPV